jgi:hypothetical protein
LKFASRFNRKFPVLRSQNSSTNDPLLFISREEVEKEIEKPGKSYSGQRCFGGQRCFRLGSNEAGSLPKFARTPARLGKVVGVEGVMRRKWLSVSRTTFGTIVRYVFASNVGLQYKEAKYDDGKNNEFHAVLLAAWAILTRME